MQLSVFIVYFSTLIVDICSAGLIIKSSEPDRSGLVEASINILESCYPDRIDTVGLAGASAGSIIKAISSRDIIIPVALIDETSRPASSDPIDPATRYKLQVFLVTVTFPSTLVETLTQVKKSKWWNHMAYFILIDSLETENGCSNAYEILWEAWKMNLLNPIFLCLHRIKGRLIYTFNPYTSEAPFPWHEDHIYKGINGHIWTLFVREYREDESPCNALDFDKTLDLGGYKVRASVRGIAARQDADSGRSPTIHEKRQLVLAQTLITSVNVTWKLLKHTIKDPVRDEKGNPSSWAAEVINGSIDIGLITLVHRAWAKYESTYPYFQNTLAVITQYPDNKSQLDKLISVLDRSSRFCLLVVLLITLLFFKCYMRQLSISAILNVVLLICNAAVSKVPKKMAPRIYLGGLLILVVTIHGIYQGKFASVLTKQERLPVVNSFDDLAQSDHKIYGLDYWYSIFNYSAFEGRYVAIPEYNCTGYVLRDPKAACFYTTTQLVNNAFDFKLHLSRKSMGTDCGIYIVRPDWPLTDRVNVIYGRAIAGDLMRPLYAGELNSLRNKLKSYEKQDQDQAFKPLTLGQLGFAFVILAIGLVCATISFIIEVSTYDTPVAGHRNRMRIGRRTH